MRITRNDSVASARRELLARIATAVFYAVASFMIMVVNKHVLTVHKFPSFQVWFTLSFPFVILDQ